MSLTAAHGERDQSNSSIIFGDKAIMKLFRRVEPGINPDLEIGRFLAERSEFANTPPLLGAIEYRANGDDPLTLAVAHALVPQAETAWQFALDNLSRYFEEMLTQPMEKWPNSEGLGHRSLWDMAESPPAADSLDNCQRLSQSRRPTRAANRRNARGAGRRHRTPDFAPEPFSHLYQRSLYQSARKLASQNHATVAEAARSTYRRRASNWAGRFSITKNNYSSG